MSEMDRLLKAVNEVEHLLCEDEELLSEALETLRFYARGEWSDGYPGGIKIREGENIHLDFGEIARVTMTKLEERLE